MDLTQYRELNNSFKRTLVFHLGADGGFFSEFNNMLLAMLYCLKHEIRFVLYTRHANFRIHSGWTDFFLPFCDETLHDSHRTLNARYPRRRTPLHHQLTIAHFKKSQNIDFLTCELWNHFRSPAFAQQKFSFPNTPPLDLLAAAQRLIQMIWRYNPETSAAVAKLSESIDLPKDYLGLHIRSGDKHIETPLLAASQYIEKAQSLSSLRHFFLSTDNYAIVEEARRHYPHLTFETLCTPEETGYIHADYLKLPAPIRHSHLLNLFASIERLASSQHFIGTFSSNPGMYLGMRMNPNQVHSALGDAWKIW